MVGFDDRRTALFNQFSSALTKNSGQLPYGTTNLDPIIQARTVGPVLVNTRTNVSSTSLSTKLYDYKGPETTHALDAVIAATEAQGDVTHFVQAKGILPDLVVPILEG